MKRIFALVLSLALLLPMLAAFAYADASVPSAQAEATEYPEVNIANEATITVEGENATSYVDVSTLVDGDKSIGTNSPYARKFGYIFTYDTTQYFTTLNFKVNGSGYAPASGMTVNNEFNIKSLIITLYKGGKVVYTTEELDVSQTEEVNLDVNMMADKITIQMPSSARSENYFMWEVETFAKKGMPLCDVQLHNVAKEARFSYYSGRDDDPETEADESQSGMWWAVNWLALTDGNIETGTHSAKANTYFINMDFSQEYLISEFVFYCNGKGFLDDGSFITIDEYAENNSMVKICLYDLNGEKVYDSKDLSVSGPTAKIDPYVYASKIEIQMFNGKFSGGEFMWEIEAYIESGNHLFELTDTKNPTCNSAGYKELSCHCGKVIKEVIPATGFHQWDDGVEVTAPTANENGVCEKTCTLCGSKGEFDVPATGHTWDNGKVIAPDCENQGYTVYTCTCATCTDKLSYKTDFKQALGHDWNEGTVTKPSKLGEQGEKVVQCLRDGCGKQKTSATRALTYFDNTASINFLDAVTSAKINFESAATSGDGYYNPNAATPPPTDDMIWNLFDGNSASTVYAPTGAVIELTLDKTYFLTSLAITASGNYNKIIIECVNEKQQTTASLLSPAINNGMDYDNLAIVDLAKVIGNGIETKMIKIIINWAKWDNGHALKMHDMTATAHSCNITEDDYVMSGSDYKAPTCTSNGSTVAVCPVCSEKTPVTLVKEKYGHNVANVVADKNATCCDNGVGHGTCTNCNQTIQNIVIPATGVHVYDKEITYVEAKCGFLGIKQMVCAGCGRVGSQDPIPATGVHDYDWVEYSPTTFTAAGKKAWECLTCKVHDPNKPEDQRIEVIPKKVPTQDLATYVSKEIGGGKITLNFTLNLEYYLEVEYECDIRVITTMVDPEGNVVTYESYGKYSKNEYDPVTGAVKAILVPSGALGDYQISTAVRLMNFRGVEYVDVDLNPETPELDKYITVTID